MSNTRFPVAPGGGLRAPSLPAPIERAPFPLIASAAPVAAAAALWAITQSSVVLLFAALGPVVAVAGLLDGKRQAVRGRRRENTRFARQLAELDEAVRFRQAGERRDAWERFPSATELAGRDDDHGRWQNRSLGEVVLGRGAVASTTHVDATAGADAGADAAAAAQAVAEVLERAAVLHDAPVTVHPATGLAIVGPAALARAVARGVLLQMARGTPPSALVLQPPAGAEWRWLDVLPHRAGTGTGTGQPDSSGAAAPVSVCIVDRTRGAGRTGAGAEGEPDACAPQPGTPAANAVPLVLADSVELVPPGCATVLRVDSARSAVIVRSPDGGAGSRLVPELLGREQAAAAAAGLARAAMRAGLLGRVGGLPDAVALHSLTGFGAPAAGLGCVIGRAASGTIALDLVANGPHAIVGGTTGSGKSELLLSWVVSMAAAHAPSEFTVLLVDFKGGAAFGAIERLPHCVGLITDLDEHEAERALASLRAELRHRELCLRAVRARELSDPQMAGTLARLVIVVDEFAAMLGSFPELHELFVDIAARGRSLGMHLLLCTQRPAGVVRDALLANCNLRLSLRVNNREDSRATLGTDEAALLPPGRPGRALVAAGDGRVIEFQAAVCDEPSRASVLGRGGGDATPAVRRPWLPPLPSELALSGVAALLEEGAQAGGPGNGDAPATRPGTAFTLGVLDQPQFQRRALAEWRPFEQGPLLVLGAARSGRSSVLAALAEQAASRGVAVQYCGADDPEGYWDALVAAAEPAGGAAGERERLLLLDDWHAVVARWPGDYAIAATELLGLALRGARQAGAHLALAADGQSGAVQTHRALIDAVLLLRLGEKSEHLRSGGTALWLANVPAGRGEWAGQGIQCACPDAGAASLWRPADWPAAHDPLVELSGRPVLVVSTRPATALRLLRSRAAAAGGAEAGATVLDLAEIGPLPASIGLPDTSAAGAGPGPAASPAASPGHHGDHAVVIVGDPDAWQARWGLLAQLRPAAALVFDGCRLSDYRSISRSRELPPLLADSPGRGAGVRVWCVEPDGRVARRRLC